MKVVILAGGFGTRISEESMYKPKPILWHIMKYYYSFGFNDFVICAGYKQHVIKEFFSNYFIHTSDITFDFTKGDSIEVHDKHCEQWKVTVVDTGLNTLTGGRIKRIEKYITENNFMLTYGDGLCDVNLYDLVKFHEKHGKIATITTRRTVWYVGHKFGQPN